ncbi:MAG: hypothetical protein GAK32_00833 [Pseudomonas fluorescens]|nr:MAG: hypothetical protein GAK32_00833 [Pseudomonas fluorescens]
MIPEDYVTSAMTAIALQSIDFTWLAPPDTFAPQQVLSLEELARWPVIVQGAHSGITQRCEQLFAQAGLELRPVYGSNSLFALVALIRAGIGISCLPRALFAEEIRRGELQEVRVETAPAPVNYKLAFLKHGQDTLMKSLANVVTGLVGALQQMP